MSQEFLLEKTELGHVGKFIGCGGTFLDVWSPDRTFLGTCKTLEQAHEMQRQHVSKGMSSGQRVKSH